MPVRNRFAEWLPELTEWRRDFHAHPELLYDTHRTAAKVAERLRAFGCDEVVEGIGRTGVVGIIEGRAKGPTVGLRADMDALPIAEETGAPHASTVPGKMHACGHDGHTTMLLGAARYLAETRNFAGRVAVIFQPAEEGGGGGLAMVEDGLIERFDIAEVYGLHNWPGMAPGSFAIRPGAFFAATDLFELVVHGRGGHAAKPHETVDPVFIASQIVAGLQGIAARQTDPVDPVVVSVTSIQSSSEAFNVIPSRVTMRGTVRTVSDSVRAATEAALGRIARGIAEAHGARAELDYMRGYPVMANAETETGFAAGIAREVGGGCDAAPIIMAGEDFAYMLQKRPGAYILLGNGDSAPVHHPEYDFDDSVMPAGCSFWVELAERRLPLG
ncbi:amidohydrolase [Palleronia sediminis]|uniref:Amidohydrolase n=1 Tax=Palleronia sediminis TaxID=2547833 RepID=A0A4R6AJV0_9RHOB|nr:M20 aminoacylase family protein [Palleronia sediminis]TDL84260.1 amidohydrolase [Palleronia sediminis]